MTTKRILNEYERAEVLVKIEPDQTLGATAELESNKLTDNLRTMSCIPQWKKRNN
jgi:hypothetical protein